MRARGVVCALASLCLLAAAHGQTTVRREGDAVVFRGSIDREGAREFLRLSADPAVLRLVIRSQGGLVDAALDMAEAVHDRGLDVEVDGACLSSCANYVFPAGRRKLLSGPGAVGWHGNMAHVLYRAQRGEGQWSEELMAQARTLARREQDFFGRIGVDGFVCWFGKIQPYAEADFYALSPQDMGRFGIRDVAVRDPAQPASPEVRMLAVDPAVLERDRPVVRLQD